MEVMDAEQKKGDSDGRFIMEEVFTTSAYQCDLLDGMIFADMQRELVSSSDMQPHFREAARQITRRRLGQDTESATNDEQNRARDSAQQYHTEKIARGSHRVRYFYNIVRICGQQIMDGVHQPGGLVAVERELLENNNRGLRQEDELLATDWVVLIAVRLSLLSSETSSAH